MSGMAGNSSHPRPCSGRKTFRGFENFEDRDHIILIDVDPESSDNVVIIDVPDSVPRKNKRSENLKEDNGWSFENVICIDDDDDDDDDEDVGGNDDALEGGKNGRSTFVGTSSRQSRKRSASDSEEERGFTPEKMNPVRLSKCKRTYSGKGSASNTYGLDVESEAESFDDDDDDDEGVDCEIVEDSSGEVKEVWERAFSKRASKCCGTSSTRVNDNSTWGAFNEDRFDDIHHNVGAEANASQFVFDIDEDPLDFQPGFCRDHFEERVENIYSSKSPYENFDHPIPEFRQTTPEVEPCPDLHHNSSNSEFAEDETTINMRQNMFEPEFFENSNVREMENFEEEEQKTSGVEKNVGEDSTLGLSSTINTLALRDDNETGLSYTEECVISEREKLKETDEYKRALEEEWASRRQALEIQAEEARRQRRLLKRRKAESLRLLDMERRQKERVEEVRNTQKKDEENMNLKAAIQSKVREKIKNLELNCQNLAMLLHSLGININGWPNPSPQAVQAAYKRALLTYHPDRTSQSDLPRQVEAEETFKLINRLKEKFSPSL